MVTTELTIPDFAIWIVFGIGLLVGLEFASLWIYSNFFKGNVIHVKLWKRWSDSKKGDLYKQISHVKVQPNQSVFSYKNKEYPLDVTSSVLINNELNVYYDVDKMIPIQFSHNQVVTLSPETFQRVFKTKLYNLLFEEGSMDNVMMWLIVGGVLIAIIIGIYSIYSITQMQDQLSLLIKMANKTAVVVIK